MPKIAPQALKTRSPLEPDWLAKAAAKKFPHRGRAASAAFDRQAALRIPYIAGAEGGNESGKTKTRILAEDGQRLRPMSFLKDAKSSSATFGRHRINISHDRAATHTIERQTKRKDPHQEVFTSLITIMIAVMMMASRTTTMPRRNHRNAGGFFFSAGLSSTTTCEYRRVSS